MLEGTDWIPTEEEIDAKTNYLGSDDQRRFDASLGESLQKIGILCEHISKATSFI